MFRMMMLAVVLLVSATTGIGNEPKKPNTVGRMKAEWCSASIDDGRLTGWVDVTVNEQYYRTIVKDGMTMQVTAEVQVTKKRPVSWDCTLNDIIALDCGESVDPADLPRLLKERGRVLVVSGSNVNLEILKPIQHLVLVVPRAKAE